MYQSDTEMLFPSRVIPTLKNLRGAAWRNLVEKVAQQAVARFRENDDALLRLYKKAEKDIEAYSKNNTPVEV